MLAALIAFTLETERKAPATNMEALVTGEVLTVTGKEGRQCFSVWSDEKQLRDTDPSQ